METTPNSTPNPPAIFGSPKSRYMQSAATIKAHKALVERDDFRNAIDHALLQYQERVAHGTEPQMAAAGFFRMQGAREFVTELIHLADETTIARTKNNDNLIHRL